MKALFLDRDGIVNIELGDYVMNMQDFAIHPPVIPFLQEAYCRGYHPIIITNQAGIAKGLYDHALVLQQHAMVKQVFAESGIPLLGAYYCPHHPDYGLCLCRKPGGLMVEKALARFRLDAAASFMLGDKERDVLCAAKAGVKGYQLPSNPSLKMLIAAMDTFEQNT